MACRRLARGGGVSERGGTRYTGATKREACMDSGKQNVRRESVVACAGWWGCGAKQTERCFGVSACQDWGMQAAELVKLASCGEQ